MMPTVKLYIWIYFFKDTQFLVKDDTFGAVEQVSTVVVFFVAQDGAGAIDLFCQEQPDQLMGQGEL